MFSLFRRKNKPVVLPRAEHCISRKDIDPDALKILYRLAALNFEAYLVGGSVRDLLLHRRPKDFDIGTDARPREIKARFKNCFLVGKRFRLAHIVYGKKTFETATFRRAPDETAVADERGLYMAEDNAFGTPEEDARRRDFTVNGLFYDIRTFSVIDYVGGLEDLKAKTIRSIGDPAIRFREDPVRMMRAVRFAAKLGFEIAPKDLKAIRLYAPELAKASSARLCEEIQRLFVQGASERSLRLAYDNGLLHALLPEMAAWLDRTPKCRERAWLALRTLDALSAKGETTSAVAIAALYAPCFLEAARDPLPKRTPEMPCSPRRMLAEAVLKPIVRAYRLPRAVWMTAADVFELSPRFCVMPKPDSPRDQRFVASPLFPEILQGAEILAALAPDAGWKLDEWRAFAQSRRDAFDAPTGKNNPHSRRSRRRPPRRKRDAPPPAGQPVAP